MGDLVMRISMFVQRGLICQRCGIEIDGEMSGSPRCCADCHDLEVANRQEDGELPSRPLVRSLAARP